MADTDPIETDGAPSNDNPYSQGVLAGDTCYVSGYGPVDPETGEPVEGDIQDQTDRVLENIAAVVDEAGGDGLEDVVKVTVYLTDLEDYERVNEAYGARVGDEPPARVCVEVSRLPDDVRVEMDATAYIG
ncbi:endoribonuclease L-PSP [Haloterrigena turkmenica DSM 5511]|uniref:Endoribonuclease L-PSP n=1 Tax=Haloterrigena turkmenica (strain ATCC 51198 / DSM 5511 / JCM 9101 / NCIMB 13204 / VKM B-1734 / 4k) TaxID=543526 RepID=D2RY54_HALTV|nr:Rid family detoxifying hydrolase [Haloterrigena turkmenica]ADB61800.1 endoribonuclease L-PSP [Haloterrigena turkmenica DSM 5511]